MGGFGDGVEFYQQLADEKAGLTPEREQEIRDYTESVMRLPRSAVGMTRAPLGDLPEYLEDLIAELDRLREVQSEATCPKCGEIVRGVTADEQLERERDRACWQLAECEKDLEGANVEVARLCALGDRLADELSRMKSPYSLNSPHGELLVAWREGRDK